MKRFYFWTLLASLILILLGVIWFFFFQNPRTPTYINPKTGILPVSGNKNPSGGKGISTTTSSTDGNPYQYISPLQKIWGKPVAGFTFAVVPVIITSTSTNNKGEEISTQTRATTTYLFFVEKETGNVYKKDFSTGKIIRVTNTTIPAVQDALFLRNGSQVVMQTYNKESRKLEVLVADVPQTVSENSPLSLGNSTFLQDGIFSFAASYDGSSLYYLVPNTKGSVLYRYNKEKGGVFVESLPLKDITLSITNKDVYVVSKPSAFISGYMFKTQPFVVLYGGKTGFSVNPSPTNSISFVSMWSNIGLFSYIHSFLDGKDTTLQGGFLSEKCSWSPTSTYLFCAGDQNTFIGQGGLPEIWYQGDISFTDSLYIIKNSGGGFSGADLLNISEEGKESIDLIKPNFDGSSSYFGFINKKDGALWLLDVIRTLSQ